MVKSFPDSIVEEVPGLVGDIARAICDSAVYPYPSHALAASLALVSAICSRKLVGKFTHATHPNLYTLAIAPTGAGKQHQISCLVEFMDLLGQSSHLAMGVGSSSALTATLADQTWLLLVMDEVGKQFQRYLSSDADYMKELPQHLLTLFSASGSIWEPGLLKGQSRIKIKNPSLCIFGTSTEGSLTRSFYREAAEDGLMGRFLLFKAEVPYAKIAKPRATFNELVIDSPILDVARSWSDSARTCHVELTPHVRELMEQDMEAHRGLLNGIVDEVEQQILARQYELISKIMLLLAVDGRDRINLVPVSEKYFLLARNIVKICGTSVVQLMHAFLSQSSC